MTGYLSPWHIAIVVLVLLLVFGARRLPELGRGLGSGMREFKDAVTGGGSRDEPRAEVPAVTEPVAAQPPTAAPKPPAEPSHPEAAPPAAAETTTTGARSPE